MAFREVFHEYIAGFNPIYSASDREYKPVHSCLVVLQHFLGDRDLPLQQCYGALLLPASAQKPWKQALSISDLCCV